MNILKKIILASYIILLLSFTVFAVEPVPQFVWGLPDQQYSFSSPADVAIDSSNNVYIIDKMGNWSVQKYTSDGEFITEWSSQSSYPWGIAIDSSDNVYVSGSTSHTITKFTSDGVFLTKWGSYGNGDGEFRNPWGLGIDSMDNVYVADRLNHRVQKFTSDGIFISKLGGPNPGTTDGRFNYVFDVGIDLATDDIYVSDVFNDRVQKFTSDGVFISKWGSAGVGDSQFRWPNSIDVNSSGEVYVSGYFGHRVQKFTSDGVFITKWGSRGSGEGQFNSAGGLEIMPSSGNVYVADIDNYRVQIFTSEGIFISHWKRSGYDDGEFKYPEDVATDYAKNFYVADTNNNRIQKLASDGVFVTKWSDYGEGDGQVRYPAGIAVGGIDVTPPSIPTGIIAVPGDTISDLFWNTSIDPSITEYVYIADTNNHRIQKFTSDGIFLTKWGGFGTGDGQLYMPKGVTVDYSSGHVYVADTDNHRIQKFTSGGAFITKWGNYGIGDGQFKYPGDIAVDSASGNVYVVDEYNNRIQKFTSNGVFISKWGSQGQGDGEFVNPRAISVAPVSKHVYVADTGQNHRVQIFTPNGVFLTKWGSFGAEDSEFNFPMGIAVDPDPDVNIYVADKYNHRIQKFVIINTKTGVNVPVNPIPQAIITFPEITEEGNTYVVPTDTAPANPPSGFAVLDQYYEINTTASYSGIITISMEYDDTGLSAANENEVKLMHYENDAWVDVTTGVDTVNNIVTGQVTSFSYFAVFAPIPPDSLAPVTTDNYEFNSVWIDQDANITLTADDDETSVAHTYYTVDGIQYEGTSITVTDEGQHTVTYWSVDIAGNTESAHTIGVWIDKNPPVTTDNYEFNSVWIKQDANITLIAVDSGSGVAHTYYTINNGVQQEGTTIIVNQEGQYTVTYWSEDNANRIETAHTINVWIDKTLPQTTASATPAPILNGWNNTPVSVNFTATDNISGVATVTPNVQITENGIYEIPYHATDNAGNIELEKTIVVKIDATAPVTTDNYQLNGVWTTQDTNITLTATDDDISNVEYTYYTVDGTKYEGTTINITEEGKYTITYWSVDALGNTESPKTIGVWIDKTLPETTVVVTPTPNPNGWNNTPVSVKFTATDNLSGVATVTPDVELTEEGTYEIPYYAVDNAGNVEEEKIVVIKIQWDIYPPITTDNYQFNGVWANQDANIALTATDDVSGVAYTYYTINNGTQQEGTTINVTTEGQSVVKYWSIDEVGNEESQHTINVWIDKIASVTTATINPVPNASGWNNTLPVSVDFTATDNLSGVKTTTPSVIVTQEGIYNIPYKSTDNADNVEIEKNIMVRADITPPQVSISASPSILWPSNHKLVKVTINGSATDLNGISSKVFTVTDEYNEVVASLTDFGQTIELIPARKGSDKDGRVYTIRVVVTDIAGKTTAKETTVVVPHDMREK